MYRKGKGKVDLMTKKSFLYGAIILFLTNVINRILGFAYQILAFRLVGEEGMGIFYMVYPIYILFIVLSTAGIPIAISKIVAERMAQGNQRGAHRVLKISLIILILASTFFTVVLLVILPYITGNILSNPKTNLCLLALIPSIIVVAISSAFRGFFQGLQDMRPTALAQIVEQITRISISLFLAVKLLPKGIEYATAGLSIGVVFGEIVGLIVISTIYYFKVHKQKSFFRLGQGENPRQLFHELFNLSAPITMDRVISTVLFSIDAILIPQRLQVAGYTITRATEIYSQLQGIALALLFFPTTVTIALATTIIPAISDAQAKRNYALVQSRITDVMKITFIVGLPSLAIFYMFPNQITQVVFKNYEAGHILRTLAIGAVFLYFLQTITGVFQGLGHAMIPFKNMVISSIFKIVIIFFLTANPSYGIIGTAIAINVAWIIESVLDVISLGGIVGFTLEINNVILKPAFCSLVMIFSMTWLYKFLMGWPLFNIATSLITALIVGLFIYLNALLFTKTIGIYEINRIPILGEKIANLLYFRH